MAALFEIVPNISEGRDSATIAKAVAAVEATGAKLLHRTSDPTHHRSVLTIAGTGEQCVAASVALAEVAAQHIDLRAHRGVHPRIGALDVLPFVPLRDATMGQAVALAYEAGALIWERLRIPSFFYGEAARNPKFRLLAQARRGEFEGLATRDDAPDTGDVRLHPSAGAIAIGARNILVAFNVVLASGNLSVAKRIAASIRERNGGFRSLRALGFQIDATHVQVSLNITDVHATPVALIVETIRTLAAKEQIAIDHCELIGLLPRDAVRDVARTYLGVS